MRCKNTPFDKLEPGMSAEVRRLCTADDLYVFAHASGNYNPLHLADQDGDLDGVPEAVAPSMWAAALISAALGNKLPGPGTLYRSQSLHFVGRAHVGEELVATVTILSKSEDGTVQFETNVCNERGDPIIVGKAEVVAPQADASFDVEIPGLTVRRHKNFEYLLERAEKLPPLNTVVVAPEDEHSLGGVLLAHDHTLIEPILVGNRDKIYATAEAMGISAGRIDRFRICEADTHDEAAALAVRLVNCGDAKALMKGHLHTDELLRHVVKRDGGLRIGRRLSHIFVMDVPGLDHFLLVTDAAINIAPTLEEKVDIVQNAIDLALSLGIRTPKAGILSAVETVNPKLQSTLDAAILSKMADRGQIRGGVVDGPLAMDNAVNIAAARTKGIKSEVAGRADILVVPNIEAGNMLAKQLTYLAHAEGGGIVMGARCPIILTSRSDDDKARLASCAIAALNAQSK